jgi:hypothetical protein
VAHHLFSQTNVFELMQERQHQLRNALMNLPHTSFDDEQLSDGLAAEHGLVVPILNENDKHATKKQVNVDVSQDLNRRIFNRSKPFNAHATELMIHIPFEGDANLFDVRPATFDNAPPWGEFDDRELRLLYQIIEPRDVEPEIERTLGQVRKYLEWLRPSAVQLQAQLKQLSASLITEWKQRTTAHDEVLGRLGIPLRPEPEQPASVVARTGRRKASAQSEHWDVSSHMPAKTKTRLPGLSLTN